MCVVILSGVVWVCVALFCVVCAWPGVMSRGVVGFDVVRYGMVLCGLGPASVV